MAAADPRGNLAGPSHGPTLTAMAGGDAGRTPGMETQRRSDHREGRPPWRSTRWRGSATPGDAGDGPARGREGAAKALEGVDTRDARLHEGRVG